MWTCSRPTRARSRRGGRARCGGSASRRGTRGTRGESSTARRRQPPVRRFSAKVTEAAPALVADSCQNLVRLSPATRSTGRAGRRAGNAASARRSRLESGGIVSVSEPVAVPVPRSVVHVVRGVEVATVTRAWLVPLLNAATYSRRAAASKRLTTRTLPCASRTAVPPVESAGCAARSAASARSRCATGWFGWSNDDPPPIGPEPIRSCVRHSSTCVGNRSCRACWSPPRPTSPTSSP